MYEVLPAANPSECHQREDSSCQTFCYKITGDVPAAVAVVCVEGSRAVDIVISCWQSASGTNALALAAILYGKWTGRDAIGDRAEDVVVCRTKDDCVEIHCHGGHAAWRAILADLQSAGAHLRDGVRDCEDVSTVAMKDLQYATTSNSAAVLLAQANGAFEQALRQLLVSIEAGERDQLRASIEVLLRHGKWGCRLRNPFRIAIVGKPNAGKSTLLNRLLGWDRAIVNAMAGTTRDLLHETMSLAGWPLTFIDTAGLRETSDVVEALGVYRSRNELKQTDLVLWLQAADAADLNAEQCDLESLPRDKMLHVLTKIDLDNTGLTNNDIVFDARICAISGQGIDDLVSLIIDRLGFPRDVEDVAVPFRKEHCDLLTEALANLHDLDLVRKITVDILGTGQSSSA